MGVWRRQEGLEEGEGTPPGGTSITTGGTRATKTTSSRVSASQLTTSGCRVWYHLCSEEGFNHFVF